MDPWDGRRSSCGSRGSYADERKMRMSWRTRARGFRHWSEDPPRRIWKEKREFKIRRKKNEKR